MTTEEISSKNTKKEILDAYEAMKQKIQEKEQNAPETANKQAHEKKVLDGASMQKPDKVMQDIANLKVSMIQSLDKIEETLVSEHKKISRVREAIDIENQNLQDIYQIKAEAGSLAALINAHAEKKEALEAEIKEKREAWEKEKQQMEQSLKEEKERVQKERKREEEEYSYSITQKRKKEEDAYKEKIAKQEKEITEKREAFEKEIQQREAFLKEHEEEYQELKQKAGQFPGQLEEAVKQKEKEVSDQLKTQFKYDKELLVKEYEGELKLKDQSINTLKEKIKDQDNQVSQLYKKVESADSNVKDIVLKAIENSGRYPVYEKASDKQEERKGRGEE